MFHNIIRVWIELQEFSLLSDMENKNFFANNFVKHFIEIFQEMCVYKYIE